MKLLKRVFWPAIEIALKLPWSRLIDGSNRTTSFRSRLIDGAFAIASESNCARTFASRTRVPETVISASVSVPATPKSTMLAAPSVVVTFWKVSACTPSPDTATV